MNKLSPAGIHLRRNLRAAAFLAAAGKKKRARVPDGHRAAWRAGSLIPKGRLERAGACTSGRVCARVYVQRRKEGCLCSIKILSRVHERNLRPPTEYFRRWSSYNRRDIFLEEKWT